MNLTDSARSWPSTPSANATQPVDLASSLVDLQVGKVEVQAGARVLETADAVLGTMLDTRA